VHTGGFGHWLSVLSPSVGHELQLSGHKIHTSLLLQAPLAAACWQLAPSANFFAISAGVASLHVQGGFVHDPGGGVGHAGGGVFRPPQPALFGPVAALTPSSQHPY